MLYSTALSGKKKMWKVEVDKNKIIVEHGYIGGKITRTETICEGKRCTGEEQAQKEAKALYQKKLKSGFSESETDTEKVKIYFPMLAHEFSEKFDIYPCIVQPKLDGIRCIIYKNDSLVFQSRNNTIFQQFPFAKELEHFFIENPSLVLDGELYHHSLGFQKITSIVRKKDHPDLDKIQYHVYDVICDEPYFKRYEIIRKIKGTNVCCVETKTAVSREEIETYHTHYTGIGYEGIMIRNPEGIYHEKARSKDLLKYKHFKDAEFLVVGHTEGKHGIPVFTCVTDKASGKPCTFGVMMKCSTSLKQEMLENVTDYYNKYLTVKYQELSEDGVPRFPIGIGFRSDHIL
jgi:ATP-dependent DNA ligase